MYIHVQLLFGIKQHLHRDLLEYCQATFKSYGDIVRLVKGFIDIFPGYVDYY